MLDRDKLAKILGLLGSAESGEILSAGRAANALIRNANTSWAEVLNQNSVGDEARALYAENNELRETAQQLLAETSALVAENNELRETTRQLVVEGRELYAEKNKLRKTTQHLLVENQALRKRATPSLAHRIAAGSKQWGHALITSAIALYGIEFLRHPLVARLRASETRAIRSIVVRSLVAAGMLLTLIIFAVLSLHDVAMFGEPLILSGTMASSGQETPEAGARSGGPSAEAERRATISDPPLIVAMATPEAIPSPTPPEAMLSPVEESTTLPATLPPAVVAPDPTAPVAEAPSPVTSLAPAKEQAAPPATSRTNSPPPEAMLSPVEESTTLPATLPPAVVAPDPTAPVAEAPSPVTSLAPAEEPAAPPAASRTNSPPPEAMLSPVEESTTLPATLPPAVVAPDPTAPVAEAPSPVTSLAPAEEPAAPPAASRTNSPPPTLSPPNQRLSAAEIAALVTRGDAFLSAGDIVSARLFYERAADGGDGGAALRLGATFDPGFLSRTGVRGAPGDPSRATSWYRRAVDLGNPAAQEHLKNLERQRFAEPGSPSH